MNTVELTARTIDSIKTGVNAQNEKRRFFLQNILPSLVLGQDYFVVDGRRVISKGGSERLAEIYNFTSEFFKDSETLASFGDPNGLIVYLCKIKHEGKPIAEGRGSASIKDHEGSANVTIKVAQASAYKDAILRATGTSFLFTQDIDSMDKFKDRTKQPLYHTQSGGDEDPSIELGQVPTIECPQDPNAMTDKQRNFLLSLITERVSGQEQTEEWLSQLNSGLSRSDASELISSLIPVR